MEEEHLNAVNSIINQASVLEDPNEVRDMQHRREEQNKKRLDTDFYNSKYWKTGTDEMDFGVCYCYCILLYIMLLLRIECIVTMKDKELWFCYTGYC